MMRNFSFLLPEVLVGSTPLSADHIAALEQCYNVGVVITLTEETPLPARWFSSSRANGTAVWAPTLERDLTELAVFACMRH